MPVESPGYGLLGSGEWLEVRKGRSEAFYSACTVELPKKAGVAPPANPSTKAIMLAESSCLGPRVKSISLQQLNALKK